LFCRNYADFNILIENDFLRHNSRFPPEVKNAYRTNGFLVVFEARFAKIQYFGEIPRFREKALFSQKLNFEEVHDFRTFPPCAANFRPQNLTKITVFGSGRENSTLEHFLW